MVPRDSKGLHPASSSRAPCGASVLDVGGGHAQIAPHLVEAGYEVSVAGSDPVCAARLAPWIGQGKCHFNILAARLFRVKQGIESNTRSFMMFTPSEIRRAFREQGFFVSAERPQFLLPMALHRWTNQAELSRVAEAPGRLLGVTRWFGSPVIVRADRRALRG